MNKMEHESGETYHEDSTSELAPHKSRGTIPATHVNIRASIFFLIAKLIVLDIMAIFIAFAFFWVVTTTILSEETKLFVISSYVGYFLLLGAAKISLSLYVVLQWLNEYYEITPDRIVYRRGIIWRKVDVYDYAHIRSIGLHQSFLGRIFNFGSLAIYDRGVYKYYYLNYIHNPLKYFELLRKLVPNADVEKAVFREHMRDTDIS